VVVVTSIFTHVPKIILVSVEDQYPRLYFLQISACVATQKLHAHTHNPIVTRSAVKSHKKLCSYTTSFNPFAAAAIESSLYLSSSKTLSYPSSLLLSHSRKILILKPWQASMSCLHGKAICSFPPTTCKPADGLALSR
jgi:hypothetical protein